MRPLASSKSTGTTRESVSSRTLRAHFTIFSQFFVSRKFDGDGGRCKLMVRKAASPLTSFTAPPRPASGAGGWQEGILSDGNRYPRVLGWNQRSLPPRKSVNSEFVYQSFVLQQVFHYVDKQNADQKRHF